MYCQAASQYFVDTVCLVCLSVRSSLCLSVSQTVTILSPAKTAEPIEMPFGMLSGNDVLHWGPDTHVKGQC